MKKILISLLTLATIFTSACGSTTKNEKTTNNTSQTTKRAVKKEIVSDQMLEMVKQDSSIVILDVRTEREFKAGHFDKAININVMRKNFTKKIQSLDKSARYIVHCRTNRRSTKAVEIMLDNGFQNVYQLMDGVKSLQTQ